MKIKGWIIRVLAGLFITGIAFAQTKDVNENLKELDQTIQSLKDSRPETQMSKSNFRWSNLESFQSDLWKAMALDPAPGAAWVPAAQVPKNLFAAELNEDLFRQLDTLKKSSVPKDLHVQSEFDQYLQTAEKIMSLRRGRQFPQARAIAKRGYLDRVYQPLQHKLSQSVGDDGAAQTKSADAEFQHAQTLIRDLKDQVAAQGREFQRKEVFGNGNQFIWYTLAAMFGFLMGIAAYRLNPDFFQKFLDQESTAPTATTHTASGAPKLDYARWLKEFEEILSRLKSSQLTHERRIEDIVQNSEKVSQHALSLYADARIKNEANLEFRMSSLLREIQHTFEQSQKLRAGDRAQINLMLEHCLKLCDGIESNSILFDRSKLIEPPHMRSAG